MTVTSYSFTHATPSSFAYILIQFESLLFIPFNAMIHDDEHAGVHLNQFYYRFINSSEDE
jgi:hypothetical protein